MEYGGKRDTLNRDTCRKGELCFKIRCAVLFAVMGSAKVLLALYKA